MNFTNVQSPHNRRKRWIFKDHLLTPLLTDETSSIVDSHRTWANSNLGREYLRIYAYMLARIVRIVDCDVVVD